MNRRGALLAAVAGLALAAAHAMAQQPGRSYRIGVAFIQGHEATQRLAQAVRERLAAHGFVEGKNLGIETMLDQCCGEHYAREAARALLRKDPDAVLTFGTTLTRAFQKETEAVPIVFTQVGDAVAYGIVEDYARPGGNTTGVSTRHLELLVKRLELLRELLPQARRVALLAYFWDPSFRAAEPVMRKTAARLGFELIAVDQMGGSPEGSLRAAADAGATAVFSYAPLMATGQRFTLEALLELAAERRMATMMSDGDDVVAGGLVSYGTDPLEIARHGADHLVRVLRGAKPAELPVDQIARFHLVISLKSARKIGLDVPQSLLVRADRVIE